jgi:protein-L-isoaspartate(D-aspartate) O-methyltransferase
MDAVRSALETVPRAGFLPRRARSRSGFDGPITIGHGQTNSQPRTVEAMLRLLDVRPGDRVLDVGSGSGWTTALLAQLTGPQGSVIGVELVPELAAWGAENLARTPYDWASIHHAVGGVLGIPEAAPYDRILVSAEAMELPQELVDQLAEDGRIVVPVRGTMMLGIRHGDDLATSRHGSYRFVPLL